MGNSNTEVSEEEDECNFPFWHTKLGDNWPLAGVPDVKTTPKFVMSIKINKKGFKPGKKYRVVLKSAKGKETPKIRQAYFKLEASDESCSTGTFRYSGPSHFPYFPYYRKNTKTEEAVATRECKTLARLYDRVGPPYRKTFAEWTAPKDVHDGCSVTIRAFVLATDEKMYYDSDDEEGQQQYQRLTIQLNKK